MTVDLVISVREANYMKGVLKGQSETVSQVMEGK